MTRKICMVLTSRTHYGRSKVLLKTLRDHPGIELQIVVAGSALLGKYGDVSREMEKDGFVVDESITMLVEGGSPVAMAKTTGLGLIEFTTAFENLKPDWVIIRGDRYEMMAVAISASYLNIPIAHIEGGDVTGTIDESVRHSITKLAHCHFPTNEESANRVRQMGENPEHIHMVGSLDVEYVKTLNLDEVPKLDSLGSLGMGAEFDLSQPFLMVLQHPVTTEYGQGHGNYLETINAIIELDMPTVWFWPNIDAGNDEVSKALRVARETRQMENVHFFRSLPPESFLSLLRHCNCLVGNSSAGIKESSILGTPVVNIGTRQDNRLRGENVSDVTYQAAAIKEAVTTQVRHGRYAPSSIYDWGRSSQLIADILAEKNINVQKRWHQPSE